MDFGAFGSISAGRSSYTCYLLEGGNPVITRAIAENIKKTTLQRMATNVFVWSVNLKDVVRRCIPGKNGTPPGELQTRNFCNCADDSRTSSSFRRRQSSAIHSNMEAILSETSF